MNLYHIKHPDFTGDEILPLNRLQEISEKIYNKASSKYIGRSHISNQGVKPLDCMWGDVIFLTPIHPSLIKQELQKYKEIDEKSFFVIPLDKLDPSKTTMFWYDNTDEFQYDNLSRLEKLNISELSDITCQHYQEFFQDDKLPFLFHGLPHVLYRGHIDTTGLEIVIW